MGVLLALALLASATAFASGMARPTPASAATCNISPPAPEFAAEVEGSARHARVWRLYQAYFLRQPDRGGFDYWVNLSGAYVSLQTISYQFAASDEFAGRYGSLDNAGFVNLLYANVLCRTPDAGGYNYWLGLLNSGALNRGEVMVLFSESNEFGLKSSSRWSFYADSDAATWLDDGYQIRSIPGGLVVDVDYRRVDFRAGHNRCAVASINGNWFHNPDRPNPTPIGFAVIDQQQLPGAVNRDDRGVLGERYRPYGADQERVWNYQGSFNLNSNLGVKQGRVLENWRSWQPASTPALDNPAEWRWAAAGIPLIINRQVWDYFSQIPTNDYTHYTTRHSFVAYDKDHGYLAFGSTTGMNSAQLINWAQTGGYDDLIKFDGGGSVELNIDGERRIAGTGRDVPLWLGIGC